MGYRLALSFVSFLVLLYSRLGTFFDLRLRLICTTPFTFFDRVEFTVSSADKLPSSSSSFLTYCFLRVTHHHNYEVCNLRWRDPFLLSSLLAFFTDPFQMILPIIYSCVDFDFVILSISGYFFFEFFKFFCTHTLLDCQVQFDFVGCGVLVHHAVRVADWIVRCYSISKKDEAFLLNLHLFGNGIDLVYLGFSFLHCIWCMKKAVDNYTIEVELHRFCHGREYYLFVGKQKKLCSKKTHGIISKMTKMRL